LLDGVDHGERLAQPVGLHEQVCVGVHVDDIVAEAVVEVRVHCGVIYELVDVVEGGVSSRHVVEHLSLNGLFTTDILVVTNDSLQ